MMRHLGAALLVLCCLPLPAPAQDVPVTVVVDFGGGRSARRALLEATAGTTLDTSQSAHFRYFREVVLPSVQTRVDKEQLLRYPRSLGATLRYERVEVEGDGELDADGNVYSTNVKLQWDSERLSYGLLVPYDFVDMGDFDAHRVGAVGFGEVSLPLGRVAALGLIAHALYTYDGYDGQGLDDVNTYGGGASMVLKLDQGEFMGAAAVSYQYTGDDTEGDNDRRHLVRTGADLGARLGERTAVTVFGIWNYDATDYDDLEVDDSYLDLGVEAALNLSPTWRLSGGYKAVVGLTDYRSNMVFLGTLLRF